MHYKNVSITNSGNALIPSEEYTHYLGGDNHHIWPVFTINNTPEAGDLILLFILEYPGLIGLHPLLQQ